ncbi:MAG: nucleoside hydrolase [Phycisphaerales bacterium]|nr:nucleoside hydrolase [Phycisphaerales bacterium]
MIRSASLCFVALFVGLPSVWAHDIGGRSAVVIDTDLGLDDAVTLAVALQSPDLAVVGIVAGVGAADAESGVRHLERLLDRFNRSDVQLYAPVEGRELGVPPFRAFAQAAWETVLPDDVPARHLPFTPQAYAPGEGKVTVLALGPLTNLAAALAADPDLVKRIGVVVVAGSPEGWNCQYDPEALKRVVGSGVNVVFVEAGDFGHKPAAWRTGALVGRQPTSVGANFVRDLLGGPGVRDHYFERFEHLHDELALLYLLDHDIFSPQRDASPSAVTPANDAFPAEALRRSLARGRQRKSRVVFSERPFPDSALQPDIVERRERILAANGPDEWFAQLQMNELHDHLGAYSVIGVKMGLRAAELLNAPPHSIRVTSYAPPVPPVSCINDGLIVATGATPGRALFTAVPGTAGPLRAAFEYNHRRVVLALKPEYIQQIREQISPLRAAHSLEDAAYWSGVRRIGLDIWENWHRRDLFEVLPENQEADATPDPQPSLE